MRQEETTARTEVIEKEQILFLQTINAPLVEFRVEKTKYLANLAMVALCSFSKECLVLCHLLLVRERDAVYPLQRFIV